MDRRNEWGEPEGWDEEDVGEEESGDVEFPWWAVSDDEDSEEGDDDECEVDCEGIDAEDAIAFSQLRRCRQQPRRGPRRLQDRSGSRPPRRGLPHQRSHRSSPQTRSWP